MYMSSSQPREAKVKHCFGERKKTKLLEFKYPNFEMPLIPKRGREFEVAWVPGSGTFLVTESLG